MIVLYKDVDDCLTLEDVVAMRDVYFDKPVQADNIKQAA